MNRKSTSPPRGRWTPPDLKGRVAVVTGASRGAGKGIATVLGECGATVYVTGRTVKGGPRPRDGAPGTVEATAREVTARGGQGVPVRCDHTRRRDVERLFARVAREEGRLDLLVNNAWGGYESGVLSLDPHWERSLDRIEAQWTAMFEAGLKAHLVASRLAIPLMLPRRRGLVVNTVAWGFNRTSDPLTLYLGALLYDLAKASIIRLAFALGREMRAHRTGLNAVAVAPGFMRTERVKRATRGKVPPGTESPEYVGRGVAHLAADPRVSRRSGTLLSAGELAREYAFTDVDGRRPPPFRFPRHPPHFRRLLIG